MAALQLPVSPSMPGIPRIPVLGSHEEEEDVIPGHKGDQDEGDASDVDIRELLEQDVLHALRNRDQAKCLLCGFLSAEKPIVSHRVLDEHALGISRLMRLQALQFIPDSYSRDDLTNLMTLCEPHAYAYDEKAWRLVPGADWRHMAVNQRPPRTLDVGIPTSDTHQMANNQASEVEEQPGIPSDDTVNSIKEASIQNKQPMFDLIIFRPADMPAEGMAWADPKSESDNAPAEISAELLRSKDCPRVLHAWRSLPLEPYVVFAAALSVIGTAYLPLPDKNIREIEQDCDDIRQAWDRWVPKATPGLTFRSEYRANAEE